MVETKFKNQYYISEKYEDGSCVITVLDDKQLFYDIPLKGCKFITDKDGFIADEFTDISLISIKEYVKENPHLTEYKLKIELRNRSLNILLSMF